MPVQPTKVGGKIGFDKLWGKAICNITANRNIYWWNRLTFTTSIDLRENTDPCSSIKQYQIIREEPCTIELESMVPGKGDAAANFLHDFRPGVILDNFYCEILDDVMRIGSGDHRCRYGALIIERSNADVNRDDFTSLRMTIRGLGYGLTTIEPASGDYDDYSEYGNSYPDSVANSF
jgi:hypothetical protein